MMMRQIRACFYAFLVLLTGCREQRTEMGVWSPPQETAKSSDSLSTSFTLYRWSGSLLSLGGDAGTYSARVLEEDGKSWKTVSKIDPGWIPMDVDSKENRFVISRGTLWSNRLEAKFSIGSLSPDGRFTTRSTASLQLYKGVLFSNAQPNLEMWSWGGTGHALFSGGTMDDREIRIPFCVEGTPVERKGHQIGMRGDLAVSANGVFASSDSGRSWRLEPIATRYSKSPVMCRTTAFHYYFAKGGRGGPFELWYSRCPRDGTSWSHPEILNKTVAGKLSEYLHAIGEDDTVHLCWLDARNEKTIRFSLTRPRAGNYEVAYCNRRDSDANWSKDVILSKGLRWAYAPSMSVDGNNVVVAWAGAKSDKEGRNEWNASDIYYVTSKDGGKTWTKPMKVTAGFKGGITSGRPQVALHKGMIHLFYVQGKINYKVSGGMALLNQPPWPIYYTQRPFPD